MRLHSLLATLFVAGIVLAAFSACGTGQSEEGAHFEMIWAAVGESPCEGGSSENSDSGYIEGRIPKNIAQLRLRLADRQGAIVKEKTIDVYAGCKSGDSNCAMESADSFEWTDIPYGQNMELRMYGYTVDTASPEPRLSWVGINDKVSLSADNPSTTVSVYMKRINVITKPFNCLHEPRAFHTATKLRDGSILVVGGVKSYQPAFSGDADLLTGTNSVERFDPTTGLFVEMTPLQRPRAFHKAVLLDDGMVLIIGGTGSAYFDPTTENIEATGTHFRPGAAGLEATAEIYNPTAQGSTVELIPMKEGRMLFDVATIPVAAGADAYLYVVIGGLGVVGDGFGKLTSTELFNYTFGDYASTYPLREFTKLSDINLNAARAGHAAFHTYDGLGILIYGGAGPNDPAMEYIKSPVEPPVDPMDSATGEMANSMYLTRPDFYKFSDNTRHRTGPFLMFGGMLQDKTTGAFLDPVANNATRIINYTGNGSTYTSVSVEPGIPVQSTAFAAAAETQDYRVIISGGITTSDFTGVSNHIEYWTGASFQPVVDPDGNAVTLRSYVSFDPDKHGRAGHTASLLPDGSVIFIGGLDIPNPTDPPLPRTAKTVLDSAEIILIQ